jgi:hypothetical protein
MAALNGVERLVTIKSWCDESALKRLHNRRCFIVSDCEGYEVELFSESVIRSLAVSDLVIELHEDSIQSGGLNVRDILSRRLAASHSVQLVNVEARDVSQFPEVSFLGNDAYKAICELGRGSDQQWLVAISKRV